MQKGDPSTGVELLVWISAHGDGMRTVRVKQEGSSKRKAADKPAGGHLGYDRVSSEAAFVELCRAMWRSLRQTAQELA